MEPTALPGLERLLEVCQRLGLDMKQSPPRSAPLAAGAPVAHHPLDPVLAAFYTRTGQGVFATRAAGLILVRVDDEVNELEHDNATVRVPLQSRLALPLFFFGGEPLMAYYYATVPALANERGHQPVVMVDGYELDEPYALPVASDVDWLFRTYSRYLEDRSTAAGLHEEGQDTLTFPWKVPHLLARDSRLVHLIRAGRFDALMPQDDTTRSWLADILR